MKEHQWIEDRLNELDRTMSEIADEWGLEGGAVVTRFINGTKPGKAIERPHLGAKWTRGLARVLSVPAEKVIARIRPSERANQAKKEAAGAPPWDVMADTPTEIVQAAAKLLNTDFEGAYVRLFNAVKKIVDSEWE